MNSRRWGYLSGGAHPDFMQRNRRLDQLRVLFHDRQLTGEPRGGIRFEGGIVNSNIIRNSFVVSREPPATVLHVSRCVRLSEIITRGVISAAKRLELKKADPIAHSLFNQRLWRWGGHWQLNWRSGRDWVRQKIGRILSRGRCRGWNRELFQRRRWRS
jgi:hypothetical protein